VEAMIKERTSASSSVMVSNYYARGWAAMWHPVNTPVEGAVSGLRSSRSLSLIF
jgi:hypothetical protein